MSSNLSNKTSSQLDPGGQNYEEEDYAEAGDLSTYSQEEFASMDDRCKRLIAIEQSLKEKEMEEKGKPKETSAPEKVSL